MTEWVLLLTCTYSEHTTTVEDQARAAKKRKIVVNVYSFGSHHLSPPDVFLQSYTHAGTHIQTELDLMNAQPVHVYIRRRAHNNNNLNDNTCVSTPIHAQRRFKISSKETILHNTCDCYIIAANTNSQLILVHTYRLAPSIAFVYSIQKSRRNQLYKYYAI